MKERRLELLAMNPDDVPRQEWKDLITALDVAVRAGLGIHPQAPNKNAAMSIGQRRFRCTMLR
jgi:hypothetical protein